MEPPKPPKVVVGDGPDFMDRAAAGLIADALAMAIATRGEASLAVAGGRTPRHAFRLLSAKSLDWRRVTITLVDERWVEPTSEDSNERLVRENLLQSEAGVATFLPMKADGAPNAAAARFAERLPDHPFDAVLLGMGDDGHFASLFPGSPALEVGLDPASDVRCIAVPAGEPAPLQPRLSLTLAEIARAGLVLLLAKGAAKQRMLDRAVEKGVDPRHLPMAALLAARPDVRILLTQ
jgi:6-phosphogluconolactonase